MSSVISPVTGTRIEPVDSYAFIRGTTATFKITFTNDGSPITVDTLTVPQMKILQPVFLNDGTAPVPIVVDTIDGALVAGQQFEYQFVWNIPANITPNTEYIASYQGYFGAMLLNFGDEFFSITATPAMIGLRQPAYATVDDVRKKKFNIDDYLPKLFAKDLTSRNNLIQDHLKDATSRLREELNISKQRGNTENYRLFCIYYTIWSIMLAARGEDGSSISDSNLLTWKGEWERILAQLKRQSVLQGVPLGRG